ncbi:hypothetical protein N7478_004797 [Penicillium angulare]|uniref:uncharacterized protein n=1 Tax=Penicillium angulare TaxID=116970 RepID=UPI0025422074|nr:uncharacterized protein N7478_004797 [Penicillium angulare]KAJ5279425.1 hypothetical protein N7478_004797 [Penicillium angulare]
MGFRKLKDRIRRSLSPPKSPRSPYSLLQNYSPDSTIHLPTPRVIVRRIFKRGASAPPAPASSLPVQSLCPIEIQAQNKEEPETTVQNPAQPPVDTAVKHPAHLPAFSISDPDTDSYHLLNRVINLGSYPAEKLDPSLASAQYPIQRVQPKIPSVWLGSQFKLLFSAHFWHQLEQLRHQKKPIQYSAHCSPDTTAESWPISPSEICQKLCPVPIPNPVPESVKPPIQASTQSPTQYSAPVPTQIHIQSHGQHSENSYQAPAAAVKIQEAEFEGFGDESLLSTPTTVVNFARHPELNSQALEATVKIEETAEGFFDESLLSTPTTIVNFDQFGRVIRPSPSSLFLPSSIPYATEPAFPFTTPAMSRKRARLDIGLDTGFDSPPPVKRHRSSDRQASNSLVPSSKRDNKHKIKKVADNKDHGVVDKVSKVEFRGNQSPSLVPPPKGSKKRKVKEVAGNEDLDIVDEVSKAEPQERQSPSPPTLPISPQDEKPSPPKRSKTTPPLSQPVQVAPGSPLATENATNLSATQKRSKKKASDRKDDYKISIKERNDLVGDVTREEAQRMVENMNAPYDPAIGGEQLELLKKLSERGATPLLSGYWARDFSTLPKRLFTLILKQGESATESELIESELMFKAQERSDLYAIKALQDVFALSGRVRDCTKLEAVPAKVIAKTITKYMRWATENAGLKAAKKPTIPVHIVSLRREGDSLRTHLARASRELEDLAIQHQKSHGCQSICWPVLLAFIVAGPVLCLMSLDTDPSSVIWSRQPTSQAEGADASDDEMAAINNRACLMTHVDLSAVDNDVWNSLSVTIGVAHVRDTMVRLATLFRGSALVPQFRDQSADPADEDQ